MGLFRYAASRVGVAFGKHGSTELRSVAQGKDPLCERDVDVTEWAKVSLDFGAGCTLNRTDKAA